MSSKNRAKSQARIRDKQYLAKLKALRSVGAYEPTGNAITPYRKRRINKAWKEFGQFVEPDPNAPKKFFFVDTAKLTGSERREFLANAKSLEMKATKRGVFIQREGQRKAHLAWNDKNKEYDIVLTGKVKWGVNKGKKISDRLPIGPYDRIGKELERIENTAAKFGPMKKGEAMSFVVVEHGEEVGATQQTFQTAKQLRDYVDTRYHRDNLVARLNFVRMVRVRKTTLIEWPAAHPAPKKRQTKRRKPLGYNPH